MMDFILRFSITLYMVAKYTTVYSGRRLGKKGGALMFLTVNKRRRFRCIFLHGEHLGLGGL